MKVKLVTLLLFIYLVVQIKSTSVTQNVEIESGLVCGQIGQFRGVDVYRFLGIPYAESPVGNLRFKRPVKRRPWSGVLNATKWSSQCIQSLFTGFDKYASIMVEDCLHVNVFTTAQAFNERQSVKRPVMVWIHGGGYNLGSASNPAGYDGTALATFENVVLVTLNYRLGVLGFLHLKEFGIEGNMGLWDQNLALKWVKTNIHAFGGDPNQVTLFGLSAGASSVTGHTISPASKGLFNRAIVQSGAIYDLDKWQQPGIHTNFITKSGCSDSVDILSCLQKYDIKLYKNDAPKDMYWPIYGDDFLPVQPEKAVSMGQLDPEIPMIIGTVGSEGDLLMMIKDMLTFHPTNPINLTVSHAKGIISKIFGENNVEYYYEKFLKNIDPNDSDKLRLGVTAAFGDPVIACPAYIFALDAVKSRNQSNIYVYRQTQRPSYRNLPLTSESPWIGATHADDLLMVFGYPNLQPKKYNIEDLILSSMMMKAWGSFARTGKPSLIGPNDWKPLILDENEPLSVIELNSQKLGGKDPDKFEFCKQNWPFPSDLPYDWKSDIGVFEDAYYDDDANCETTSALKNSQTPCLVDQSMGIARNCASNEKRLLIILNIIWFYYYLC